MENNPLMVYRPISQVVKIFIIPEIKKRVKEKRLNAESLPLELHNFHVYQQKKLDGKVNSIVELNEEIKVKARTKLKGKKFDKDMIGKHISINEIHADDFYIMPPEYEGRPCAYFYFSRIFLYPRFCWDCRPNLPDFVEEEKMEIKSKYPIEDLVKEKIFVETIKPYEKLNTLIKNDWPPTPGYYPNIFDEMHKDSTFLASDKMMKLIESCFDRSYWKQRISFWKQANFFTKRLGYVEKSVEELFEGDYVSSIYVLCPQFEGIIRDYLQENEAKIGGYKDNIDSLKTLLYSREALLYPKKILDKILEYLKEGSFTQRTKKIQDPQRQVNRHGIVHGIFSGFESEELALKLLLLLDSLAFVLLSDKIASGKL